MFNNLGQKESVKRSATTYDLNFENAKSMYLLSCLIFINNFVPLNEKGIIIKFPNWTVERF